MQALVLANLGLMLPAEAQESCARMSIYFRAAEDTELNGKLAVGYEQTGGGRYGFAEFQT